MVISWQVGSEWTELEIFELVGEDPQIRDMPALISLDQMARWQMRFVFTTASYRAFAFGEEVPVMLTPDGHPYLSLVRIPRISRSPREASVVSEEQEPSSSDEREWREWHARGWSGVDGPPVRLPLLFD